MLANLMIAVLVAVSSDGRPHWAAAAQRAAAAPAEASAGQVGATHINFLSHRYFAGCGVLGHGPQSCTMFHADNGVSFAIGNTGGFSIGDRVYVTGIVVEDSLMCWPHVIPAIEDNTINACFAGCGVIDWHGPQGCTMFHADSGESLAIGNGDGFAHGDYVYVTGPVVEDSLMCWPAVVPAIEDNTIDACFAGCGVLGRGPQNCFILFHPDTGGTFVLDDIGDFTLGDRIHVTGRVVEDSLACWPATTPAIEDNTVSACPLD